MSETSCSNKISNSTDGLVTKTIIIKTIIIIAILSFILSIVLHSTILNILSFTCIAICGLFLYTTSEAKEKKSYEVATTLIKEYQTVIESTAQCFNMVDSLWAQVEENRDNGRVDLSNDIKETIESLQKWQVKATEHRLVNTNTIPIILDVILGIDRNNIKSSCIKQQEDSYNCGIYALTNAKIITDMFNSDMPFNEIDKQLQKNKLTPEQLIAKRKEFKENLSKAEKQNVYPAPVSVVLSQTTEVKQSSDSLGGHK